MSRKRRDGYVPLGQMMFDLALETREVEGPYSIAKYMTAELDKKIHGPSVSEYFRGTYDPPPQFMVDFAEAFGLDENQRRRLAWVYAYRFPAAA